MPIAACAIGRRLPQIPAIAGFCISLFLLAISDMGVPISPGFYYFERAACGLAAGHYLFRLYRPWGSPRITIACVAGLFGLFFVAEITPIFGKLVPLAAALAIWSGATAESRLLSCRLAQWLGAISYTVYMAHMPVLNAMLAISSTVNANPGAKVFALMVSIILAGVLTRFVEKPMMALGGRIAARTR